MKKKFVGVSYESDDGNWRVDVEGDHFHLFDVDNDLVITLSSTHLLELSQLFSDIITDIGIKEPVQIANTGDGLVSAITLPMDMRFHPDPDGVMDF